MSSPLQSKLRIKRDVKMSLICVDALLLLSDNTFNSERESESAGKIKLMYILTLESGRKYCIFL